MNSTAAMGIASLCLENVTVTGIAATVWMKETAHTTSVDHKNSPAVVDNASLGI